METNCPCCPNHCPADALRCGRGHAHFAQNSGEPRDEQPHHEAHAPHGHGHPMQETEPTLALLRQCGHFLHHMGPGCDAAQLMSALTDEERTTLQALLKKCLDSWQAAAPQHP